MYYNLRNLALTVFNLTNLTSADDKMVKIKAPEVGLLYLGLCLGILSQIEVREEPIL